MKGSRRGGVSLIELLVVISLLGAVMLLVGRMLYGLFRAEQASTQDVLLSRSAAELSVRFRSDIHAASAISSEATHVECELPGGPVSYRRQEQQVTRISGSRRDIYRLPGSNVSFRPTADGRGAEIVLSRALPQLTLTASTASERSEILIRARPRHAGGLTP